MSSHYEGIDHGLDGASVTLVGPVAFSATLWRKTPGGPTVVITATKNWVTNITVPSLVEVGEVLDAQRVSLPQEPCVAVEAPFVGPNRGVAITLAINIGVVMTPMIKRTKTAVHLLNIPEWRRLTYGEGWARAIEGKDTAEKAKAAAHKFIPELIPSLVPLLDKIRAERIGKTGSKPNDEHITHVLEAAGIAFAKRKLSGSIAAEQDAANPKRRKKRENATFHRG